MWWPVPSGCRRSDGSEMLLRLATVCFIGAAWLPSLGRADTYDIGIKVYTDPNCLFWAEDLVILDAGCYANRWAPNATKGYKMNIVDFNSPQRMDMREFTDDCHSLAMPKRTVTTGTDRCTPFLGSMYAQFDIRFRSNTCKGALCSHLGIAIQTFYNEATCNGMAFAIFRYPIQGECLRAYNGTQALSTGGGDHNLTLFDYNGGDDCTQGADVKTKTYSIISSNCYPLYTEIAPRSFSWVVERVSPTAVANHAHRHLIFWSLHLWTALSLFLF